MLNFREILAKLAFPIVMGVGLFATFYFIHIKEVAINKVTFPVVFIALIIIALLEHLIPFRSGWNKNDGDVFQEEVYKPAGFYEREDYYHNLVNNE